MKTSEPHPHTSPSPVFRFECRMCGSCCRDDRLIVLTPQDIFNLSRHAGLDTGGFLAAHCDVQRDAGLNGVPVAALRTPGGACVFLDGALCAVHAARPACCRNYPLGTRLDPDGALQHELMRPAPGCGGFGAGPEFSADQWWRQAGMRDCLPGIRLMELAARAVTRRLDALQRERLYALLCDFDTLPAARAAASFDALYPRLRAGLESILEQAPRLQKP